MIKENKYSLSSPFNYENDYGYSIDDPNSFWNEISLKYKIYWDKPYEKVLDYNNETFKTEWFKGGKINACFNALDKHFLNGDKKGKDIAFVHEIPILGKRYEITYWELYEKVCKFSKVLKELGIGKGDIVLIYMHNSFETIISMLSCARIGAIHNVIYSGSLSDGLSQNIQENKPKLIIISSFGLLHDDKPQYYIPILKDALLKSSHKPNNIIIYNRKDIELINNNNNNINDQQQIEGSLDWYKLLNNIKNESALFDQYESVESNHPLYLTYSSGTTNKPKGIVRETGSNIVCINYAIRNFFQFDEGDTYYSGASLAWTSSHNFLIYGVLFVGGKSAFLEGPYKDLSNDLWEMLSRNKSKLCLITPIMTRRLIKLDPNGNNAKKYDLSSLKFPIVGGESVQPSIIQYLSKILNNKPIHIEYWQTESGWHCLSNSIGLPIKSNSLGKPIPSYNIKILNNNNNIVKECESNEIGEICIKLPLPPGNTLKLFGDDDISSTLYNQNYLNKYHGGYFATGDMGYFDKDGYFFFVSRVGDNLTVGNHSINCNILEDDIIEEFENYISECHIVGIKDFEFNQIPLALLIFKNSNNNDDEQINKIKSQISNFILNRIFASSCNFKPIILKVNNVPKNLNGKTLKSLIKSIFNGDKFIIPSIISNENSIDELLNEYKNLNL